MANQAVYLLKNESGKTVADIRNIKVEELPTIGSDDVIVRICQSTLNYKDALAITGRSPVIRKFPMVPGIDFAGKVISSESEKWKLGDEVILNGWGVGEQYWGGLSQVARVSGDWLTSLPSGLNLRQTMALGTAGYTASLALLALIDSGVAPEDGEILVTGATGGVGSVAIMLLAASGYRVVASTGKTVETAHLIHLGASEVIDRSILGAPGKPLQRERWAGVIDSVGSHTLANACAATKYGGVVAACGLAQGMDFPVTVAPFILRGVKLLGIDSVMASHIARDRAWAQLAAVINAEKLESNTEDVPLSKLIALASDLLAGKIAGRVVVNVNT